MVYSGIYFRSTVIVIQYSVQVVRGTYMYVVREVSVSSVSCAISKSQDVQLSNYRVEGSSSRGTTCIQVQRYNHFFFFFLNPTTLQQIKRDQMIISSLVHQLIVLIFFQLALNLHSYIAHARVTQRIQCGGRYFLCFHFICFVIIRGFFRVLHQCFRWHANH